MLNILVTGSNGQLGSELQELSSNYEYNFFFTNRTNIDITNKDNIKEYCQNNSINAIINCAAYTAVDKAETDVENADLINRKAVKKLSIVSDELDIKLIHISTDYVFDGTNYKPYCEEYQTNPQSVYGKTKRDGENEMIKINPHNSIVIRTSWVYSSFGNNFVKTMIKLGNVKDELGIIFDQVGTPTYARDLAKTILDIVPNIKNDKVALYNYSNEGVLSWYDFAKEIMKMAKIECDINPIETFEYLALNADAPVPKGKVGHPTPAKRPHYSLLNKSKIKKEFNITIPYWKDSLDKCLKVMRERN
ncbi:MAG: dTDP-4-dehydrorhamnose reductase [Arcobacteraceae bacterium]